MKSRKEIRKTKLERSNIPLIGVPGGYGESGRSNVQENG